MRDALAGLLMESEGGSGEQRSRVEIDWPVGIREIMPLDRSPGAHHGTYPTRVSAAPTQRLTLGLRVAKCL